MNLRKFENLEKKVTPGQAERIVLHIVHESLDSREVDRWSDLVKKFCLDTTEDSNHARENGAWSFLKVLELIQDNTGGNMTKGF